MRYILHVRSVVQGVLVTETRSPCFLRSDEDDEDDSEMDDDEDGNEVKSLQMDPRNHALLAGSYVLTLYSVNKTLFDTI